MDVSRSINLLGHAFSMRNGKSFKNEFTLPFSSLPLSPSQDSRAVSNQTQENIQRLNIPVLCRNKFNDSNLASAVSSRFDTILSLLANDPTRGSCFHNNIKITIACIFSYKYISLRIYFVAFRNMVVTYNNALDYFSSSRDDDDDTFWFLPTLIQVSNDLRIVATMVSLLIYCLHEFKIIKVYY